MVSSSLRGIALDNGRDVAVELSAGSAADVQAAFVALAEEIGMVHTDVLNRRLQPLQGRISDAKSRIALIQKAFDDQNQRILDSAESKNQSHSPALAPPLPASILLWNELHDRVQTYTNLVELSEPTVVHPEPDTYPVASFSLEPLRTSILTGIIMLAAMTVLTIVVNHPHARWRSEATDSLFGLSAPVSPRRLVMATFSASAAVILSGAALLLCILYIAAYRPVLLLSFFFILFTLAWRTMSAMFIDLAGPVWSSQTVRYIGPGIATPLHVLAYFTTLVPFLILLRPKRIESWFDGVDIRRPPPGILTLSDATVALSSLFLAVLFFDLVRRGSIPLFAHLERFVYTAQYAGAAHRWLVQSGNFLNIWWG
jgi:hypothetical protein